MKQLNIEEIKKIVKENNLETYYSAFDIDKPKLHSIKDLLYTYDNLSNNYKRELLLYVIKMTALATLLGCTGTVLYIVGGSYLKTHILYVPIMYTSTILFIASFVIACITPESSQCNMKRLSKDRLISIMNNILINTWFGKESSNEQDTIRFRINDEWVVDKNEAVIDTRGEVYSVYIDEHGYTRGKLITDEEEKDKLRKKLVFY